jgi:predicted nucleic acid-binding protein
MDRLKYLLDTNVVSDYIKQFQPTTNRLNGAMDAGHLLYICQPVIYEVLRGILKAEAKAQQRAFQEQFLPLFDFLPVMDSDWVEAAHLWAEVRRSGQQLSDIDILIAVMSRRVQAVVVTSDEDFNHLPVARENWRL